MPLSSKEKSAIWRAKIKANPELHHAYLESEKKRRADRKSDGNLKVIADHSERDRRAIRKNWRMQQQVCRQKKNELNLSVDPGSSKISETSGLSLTSMSAKTRGRKKVIGGRAKVYREYAKLKVKLVMMTRHKNKYKQRLLRVRMNSSNKRSNTPNSKTNVLLKNCRVGAPVRRTILFHNVLVDGLGSVIKASGQDAALKQSIRKIIPAKKLASYRLLRIAQGYLNCSRSFLKSCAGKKKKRKNAMTTDVVKKVVAFYERDDVSSMTSGKKQCITRRKLKKQKRCLKDTLKRLHLKFLCENAEMTLSYTMFCKFRPFWVVAPSVDDRETCACQTCDNLEFMSGKLLFYGVTNTRTLEVLSRQLTCKGSAAKTCMYRECHDCTNRNLERQPTVKFNWGQIVSWNLWKSQTETRLRHVKDKDEEITVKVIVKDLVTGTIEQLTNDFEAELKKRGCRHLYNIEHQFLAIRQMKKNIKSDEAVLHIDFAENYVCKLSSEVQAMHFGASKGQVTMHNGVLYLQERKLAFSTLSSSTRHDPAAIWAYLLPVIEWVITLVPNLRVLRFISDSPATQYRCKKNFHLFCNQLFEVCPPTLQLGSWDYSEAGHGKGAADGVGALLKRTADRFVAQGCDLPDAAAVFEALVDPQLNLSVKLFFVNSHKIADMDLLMPEHLKTLIGTMTVHQIFTKTKGEITFRPISCYCRVEFDSFPCECYSPSTMVYNATVALPRNVSTQLPPAEDHLPEDDITNTSTQVLHELPDAPLPLMSPFEQASPVQNLLLPIEEPNDEHVGKFCVVAYNGRPYPGKIISVHLLDSDIEVSCMATIKGPTRSVVNRFFWPIAPDICFYELQNIVTLIDEPKPIDLHSRHCALDESVWAGILLKLGL